MLADDRSRVCNDLKTKCPNTQLLYITPEQAATSSFQVNNIFWAVNMTNIKTPLSSNRKFWLIYISINSFLTLWLMKHIV